MEGDAATGDRVKSNGERQRNDRKKVDVMSRVEEGMWGGGGGDRRRGGLR